VDTAGVVLNDAEVVVRTVEFGVANLLLELPDAALLGLALVDDLVKVAAGWGGLLGNFGAVLGTWVDAGKLEGVLDGLALLAGVATLGDFSVVTHIEEGVDDLTVGDPDIDDRDLRVLHALGHEVGVDNSLNVVLA